MNEAIILNTDTAKYPTDLQAAIDKINAKNGTIVSVTCFNSLTTTAVVVTIYFTV